MEFEVASTEGVRLRRREILSAAVHAIGFEGDSKRLRKEKIPDYLVTEGCPLRFRSPLLLESIDDERLRSSVDLAAQDGKFTEHVGLALNPSSAREEVKAFTVAAVACSEFLRRGRTFTWRSAEQIYRVAPKRYATTEEDEEINDEFFELCEVYELLVIRSVLADGHTEFEERMLLKVIHERIGAFLPTIVIVDSRATTSEMVSLLVNTLLQYFDTVRDL